MVQHFKSRGKSSSVLKKVSWDSAPSHPGISFPDCCVGSHDHIDSLLYILLQEFTKYMRELGVKDDTITDKAFAAFDSNPSTGVPYHDVVDGLE